MRQLMKGSPGNDAVGKFDFMLGKIARSGTRTMPEAGKPPSMSKDPYKVDPIGC